MRAITTVAELRSLPVGSVCVDPFDAKGDAPVVICRNALRLWQAMGGDEAGPTFTDEQVIAVTRGRLLSVYVPGEVAERTAEARRSAPRDLAVEWLTLWWDETTWYPFGESEHADITGPGHQDPEAFVAAVLAYDKACSSPGDDPTPHDVGEVGHRWALFEGDPDEPSLRLVPEDTPDAVPVTTIWGIR